MPAEKIYASPNATIAMRRQRTNGNPAVLGLYKFLEMQVSPRFSSDMSNLGIEVGGATISEQRSIKEAYKPGLSLNGHLRVGAMLNLLLGNDMLPLSVGQAPGVAVTTTLSAAGARHDRVINLTSNTGLVAGDWIQIGALATPGSPVVSDKSEVHEIQAITSGAQNSIQRVVVKATAGTAPWSFNGQTTAGLAYNVSTSALQTALEGLSSVGSGNVAVSGSVGNYIIELQGTLAGAPQPLITVDPALLTLTQSSIIVPGRVWIYESQPGSATAKVILKGGLIQAFASGAAVAKVDNAKWVTHYMLPISSDHPVAQDYFTAYVTFGNGVNTLSALFYDGKAGGFNPSAQTGGISTVSSEFKCIDTTKNPTLLAAVTTNADPSAVVVNNTRGTFNALGNTVDAPTGMSFTIATEHYEDVVLTKYKRQSIVAIGRTVSATTNGKFVKEYFDKITHGGTTSNDEEVVDAIPESSFQYYMESAKVVGATTQSYSFGINAPNCQFADYNPELNTNQPVTGNMGMVKVVPNESTGNDTYYFRAINTCTSDVYAS